MSDEVRGDEGMAGGDGDEDEGMAGGDGDEAAGMAGGGGNRGDEAGGRTILIHRVIGRLNVGGPAMHVVNLARALDSRHERRPDGDYRHERRSGADSHGDDRHERRPHDAHALRFRTRLIAGSVPPSEGDMEYYAADRGVEITRIPEMSREVSPTDDAVALARLVRLFRRERPDVVHTHTAKAGALGRVAAVLAGVPVRVHTFHGHVLGGDYFPPRVTAAYRAIERQLARATDRLVVLTEGQRRELAAEHGVASPERFEVIPLGLELGPFLEVDRAAARREVRAELGLPADAPVAGIVGRLVPIKNHELLLRALALLRSGVVAPGAETSGGPGSVVEGPASGPAARAHPGDLRDTRLLVVGGGGREPGLRALAAELGVADAVTWLGWRTDVPRLYAAMDVLALTSRDEGTPVAVIEALATGTPVVARAVGGVPELVSALLADRSQGSGRAGTPGTASEGAGTPARLVHEATPDAVARGLADALSGGEGGIARPLRRSISRRFSVERLADDLAGLYERELRRKGLLP